jgi:polysaccharide pyruvyl transferase WcaK-like protein
MRILIDHSGYDLGNIGDIAMLQVCAKRVTEQFPDSHIDVICYPHADLSNILPSCHRVTFSSDDVPIVRRAPRRYRRISEQLHKILAPKLHWATTRLLGPAPPGSIRYALERADVVVASGGGFLADAWWWHGAGVLSVLATAQWLGKPTAMFGQALGPLTNPYLWHALRQVVPGLAIIGLRESMQSRSEMIAVGARDEQLRVTGDDGLELAVSNDGPMLGGTDLGVNLRVAKYAGANDDSARTIANTVIEVARQWDCQIRPLPVSFNRDALDSTAISTHIAGPYRTAETSAPATRPAEFREAISKCQAIITGSYHAAVFGLAQGIPTTTLIMSDYYAAKFYGLRALFPEGCRTVDCRMGIEPEQIKDSLAASWRAGSSTRQVTFARALSQVESSRSCYSEFFASLGPNSDRESRLLT